ncbi:MAG: hypothetical protein ACI32N_04450 [Bulleidia sp.]
MKTIDVIDDDIDIGDMLEEVLKKEGYAVVSMSSVFVMIAMLVNNKAICAVASMITALVLLMGAFTVESRLQEPEYITNSFQMSETGEMEQYDPVLNPKYLTGFTREIYQSVQDVQPSGQMIQMVMHSGLPEHMNRFPVYSVVLTVMTTGIGMELFRHKNIR